VKVRVNMWGGRVKMYEGWVWNWGVEVEMDQRGLLVCPGCTGLLRRFVTAVLAQKSDGRRRSDGGGAEGPEGAGWRIPRYIR
jgi:hypothetical protein